VTVYVSTSASAGGEDSFRQEGQRTRPANKSGKGGKKDKDKKDKDKKDKDKKKKPPKATEEVRRRLRRQHHEQRGRVQARQRQEPREVAGNMHKPTKTCGEFRAPVFAEAPAAIPEGYRRPKGNEVTYKVVQKLEQVPQQLASDHLWMSTEFDDKGKHYKLRTEYTANKIGERGPQGWHKGVTVYIKK